MKDLIPSGALDRHIALLGATGSGKTSAAKTGIVEPALHDGRRVCVIDPTGAWWGLRMRADGKKGFPIYIFGGDHGDYPLRARDAEMLAEAFGTSSDSAIFDTSLMTVTERTAFFTDFAEAIRRKNRGPLNLVIDEAHLFMPQAGAQFGAATPAMLHAGNNLVSLGRSKGLRITLISQRPAKLHKDSLTQVQSMVAMRLMAPQDRKAIAEWIADQADPERGKEIIASLPSLKPGEAWVWAPQDNVLDRVKFPLPKSYDSSKAPTASDGAGPQLSPIDLDKLTGRLKAVEDERKANDPKALRAEVVRLTSEIARMRNEPRIDDGAIQEAERRGYASGHHQGLRAAEKAHLELVDRVHAVVGEFTESLSRAMNAVIVAAVPAEPRAPNPASPAASKQPVSAPARGIPSPAASGDGELSAPQRKVVRSVAMWTSLGHPEPTRQMVAAAAGYSPSSGGFNNLIGALNSMGAITIPRPGTVRLCWGGETMDRSEGAEMLIGSLSKPQLALVKALRSAGRTITRAELAEATNYSANSGGFNNLIGSLSSLGIIAKPSPGAVELADWAAFLITA